MSERKKKTESVTIYPDYDDGGITLLNVTESIARENTTGEDVSDSVRLYSEGDEIRAIWLRDETDQEIVEREIKECKQSVVNKRIFSNYVNSGLHNGTVTKEEVQELLDSYN